MLGRTVKAQDAAHVLARLAVGRHAAMALHRFFARVVGGRGQCHIAVETPVKLTEHQRKLLRELEDSLKKGGARHSPSGESWTDRLKNFFS